MAKVGFKINTSDQRRLTNKLKSLDKFAEYDLNRIINTEAQKTVDKMQNDAPYDTGRLRKHIGFDFTSSTIGEFTSFAKDPKTGADYAPDQEFGTRFQPAQPYFYKNIRKFNQNLRVALSNILTKILIKR